MNWAYKQKLGDGIAKAILVAISNQSDQDGKCWPSIDYITTRTEFARRTIINKLEWLEQKGFVTRERRIGGEGGGAKSNVYHLRMSESAPHAPPSESARQVGESARHDRESAPGAPEQSINNQLIKKKVRAGKKRKEFFVWCAEHSCDVEAIDWESVLKKKKAAMTDNAWQRRLDLLIKLSNNERPGDVLSRSADSGWTSMYARKEKTNGTEKETAVQRRERQYREALGIHPRAPGSRL